MPRSDSCLISSSSHNPNQNDSGSVLQGNWGMGMHCMDGATLILPDKSIIFPQSGSFKKLNPGCRGRGVQIYGWDQIMEHAEQTAWLK